jgi:MarR family transcriptional regulator for hemolysin
MTLTDPSRALNVPQPFGTDLNWLLHRVGFSLGSLISEVVVPYGLSVRTWVVLSTVRSNPDMTQLALGSALGLDKTTMTAAIDRLEQAGLVTRREAPGDRRARIVNITDPGRQLADQVETETSARQAAVLADVAETDLDNLLRTLQQLAFGPFTESAPITGSCI